MSQANPNPPSSNPTVESLFRNKRGSLSDKLRMKEGEEIEKAVERLRRDGWEIGDIGELVAESDAIGKYFRKK